MNLLLKIDHQLNLKFLNCLIQKLAHKIGEKTKFEEYAVLIFSIKIIIPSQVLIILLSIIKILCRNSTQFMNA